MNCNSRAVIKGRVLGISFGFHEYGPLLLPQENRRKIEPKEIPSSLIHHLLVVFTWQLEISMTAPNREANVAMAKCLDDKKLKRLLKK